MELQEWIEKSMAMPSACETPVYKCKKIKMCKQKLGECVLGNNLTMDNCSMKNLYNLIHTQICSGSTVEK